MLYAAKVLLLFASGAAYLAAGVWRWHLLGQRGPQPSAWPGRFVALGVALHSAALLLALVFPEHADLVFAGGGTWGAAVAMLVVTRLLGLPGPGLLLAPVGVLSLLVAAAATLDGGVVHGHGDGRHTWVFFAHVWFMSAAFAAGLLAGTGAILYQVARRQLKSASGRALRLPGLPRLAALTEYSLAVAACMLVGGVASGSVAIGRSAAFTLAHPTPLLALALLAGTFATLVLRRLQPLGPTTLSWYVIALLGIEMAAVVSLLTVPPHG